MQNFNFFEEKALIEALQKNRPYLIDIEKLVQKIRFGLINISLRVHDSKVTDVTVQGFQKIRYNFGKGEQLGERESETFVSGK